jgi:UDP-N-acetylmuramate dehydrogenase
MEFTDRCESGVFLSSISTFDIGGPAALLFRAQSVEDLQEAMHYVATTQTPYLVVGRGSNCLFPDSGFSGLVIVNRVEGVCDEGRGRFIAGGGARFPSLGLQTARGGWTGLEFAAGIPGSIGGAVCMNAGAQGQQTGAAVVAVDYVDERGDLVRLERGDLSFGYRSSSFRGKGGIIASVTFQLPYDEQALKRQREMVEYRMRTQPTERSAGCVFRNPPGLSAGRLIDEAGLKGRRIGGAEVSPLHANFIINRGGATAADVRALIEIVRSEVSERSGVHLDCEVLCY